MYFVLLVVLLILFFWLGWVISKSTIKGPIFLLSLSVIFILVVSSLFILSYHYKEINPSALILALIIIFTLMMFYIVRRLR